MIKTLVLNNPVRNSALILATLAPLNTAASLAPRASLNTSASLPLSKRTAFKLARQLWNFQGYTHKQHDKADQLHQQYH